MANVQIWQEYYQQHLRLAPNSVREGCEPRIIVQEEPKDNTVVLVHGLTDSPYFMEAIGKRFHEMGFNVLIPLLSGHGLKDPRGMKGVTLEQWLDNVNFAIQKARELSPQVSIGGLSTGGALSAYKAITAPQEITGGVFLFSAALDLAGIAGNLIEKLLRTRVVLPILAHLEDWRDKPLVGDNLYRYARMDRDGAAQLSHLIEDIDRLIKREGEQVLKQPLFVVHSEYDTAANIQGVENLIIKSDPAKVEFFRIGKFFEVPHASVVLAEDVRAANGSPLEPKNPFFNEMMACAHKFCQKHLKI